MANGTGVMENEQIISALKAKRSLIAKTIAAVEREISRHRAELEHIEAVLRIFNPNFAAEAAAPDEGKAEAVASVAEVAFSETLPGETGARAPQPGGARLRIRKAKPRKKQQTRYFRRGELPELCLEVLKSAAGSLLQSDGIAEAINQKKGFVSAADSYKAATATQTRPVLRTLAKQGIVRRVGTGKGSKWRLAVQESSAPA